jgi:DnaJ-class molecular chaperone
MTEKDYYRILEVNRKATEEEIKQAYRRLALRCHPDRNPGDPRAEERFKNISEAYGVLSDRERRRRYDLGQTTTRGTYDYRQQDIFRDMFRDRSTHDLFRELSREFEKYGVRFDQEFVNRVFFGGRGFFVGGVFFGGPIFGGSPFSQGLGRSFPFDRTVKRSPLHGSQHGTVKGDFLSRLGRKMETLLRAPSQKPILGGRPLDITYDLTLPRREATGGSKVRIAYEREGKREKLEVTVPPGTTSGSHLRLRGKGMPNPAGGPPGDLYLHIKIAG